MIDYDALISDLDRMVRELSGVWGLIADDNVVHFDEQPIDPGMCLDAIEIIERQKQEILDSPQYKEWKEEGFYV